ncbi:flavin reductase family protein [Actinoplanes philippinensis]|uniref:flavin reductase family protein n=1 Tax=Actinoplanes philippinensis TaxID=35752 RepID=UPI0033F5F04F
MSIMDGFPASPVSPTETFRAAMRTVLQPTALLSCETDEGEIVACVVNTVFPVSAEVPSLGVSLGVNSRTCRQVLHTGTFWISFFTSDDRQYMYEVAGASTTVRSEVAGLPDPAGEPIMSNSATAFKCVMARHLTTWDHSLVIGQVTGIRVGETECLSL